MAYNPLERLKNGDIDFLYNFINNPYMYDSLVQEIRKSDQHEEIIKASFKKLLSNFPFFAFSIISNRKEYTNISKMMLDTIIKNYQFDKNSINLILENEEIARFYIKKNFYVLIDKFEDRIDDFFDCLFDDFNNCFKFLSGISIDENMHVRYLFMKYLITKKKEYINVFYDDMSNYITKYPEIGYKQVNLFNDEIMSSKDEMMDNKEVSELAYLIYDNDIDYSLYAKFKRKIIANYDYNYLMQFLMSKKGELRKNYYSVIDNKKGLEEIEKDGDMLFKTALTGRLNVLECYPKLITKSLLEEYKNYLLMFKNRNKIDASYRHIEYYGLDRLLEEYVTKYLDLSREKGYKFIGSGSTASAFKIGDYVFKLCDGKWSYEDVICPNLYLILDNLEEIYLRDNNGVVIAGIEVQKYLKRSINKVPREIIDAYYDELKRLGYYLREYITYEGNAKMLSSYLESSNPNPPEWFKEYPIVLVDRDRIYKLENKHPKQLVSCSY